VLISLGIYSDAWLSASKEKEDVGFTRGRRSEGVAEYLVSDLEKIAETRCEDEGKPPHVVRTEINAELTSIPALEKFSDKNLRISPTNPSRGKHLTDITPYVQFMHDVKNNQLLKPYAIRNALIRIRKVTKNENDFKIWKAVTGAITKGNPTLHAAYEALSDVLSTVDRFAQLNERIKIIDNDIKKEEKEHEGEVGNLFGDDDDENK
jgi:hypothetical protein